MGTESETKNHLTGGCQCEAIRYEIAGDPLAVIMCHCIDCQRQSGSAFGMSMTTPAAIFRITKGSTRSFTRPAESGGTVECFFCPDCGTRIYHTPSLLAGLVNIKPGTLDDTSILEPSIAVWLDRKQGWVSIPDGLRTFERNPTG